MNVLQNDSSTSEELAPFCNQRRRPFGVQGNPATMMRDTHRNRTMYRSRAERHLSARTTCGDDADLVSAQFDNPTIAWYT
jgi:hypothetical protein